MEERADVIRYDLRLPTYDPIDCPKELWIDHAIVQETAATYAQDVLNYLDEGKTPNDSPALQKTKGAKLRKYTGLNSVVERLVTEKKLTFRPRQAFPVISSLGYFNADMIELLKFYRARFDDYIKSLPRGMGSLWSRRKAGTSVNWRALFALP